MTRLFRVLAAVALLGHLFGVAATAEAQLAAGTLTGRVRDPPALAVAGAAVTVRGEG